MRKTIVSLLAIAVLALPAAGKTPKKVKTAENVNPFMTEYTTKYQIPPFETIKYEPDGKNNPLTAFNARGEVQRDFAR